ncbi:DODA-type extradiol aromatic ring-opening family dioxygenase [Salinicola aestuarinus]|uniref:DODA-type extradiol aromatic ring-opening family dioxygenase n=1 Tax=Salinicola aestuarinus TaxID=1949082 RepID=UPI0013006C03|nr:class III extradiol ring-cleavage dioxygenase [Salinicola aestuarinus]
MTQRETPQRQTTQRETPQSKVLYLSHGSPDLTLSDHPARDFLQALGQRLPKPRGALVISAHFETAGLTLGVAPQPRTWHDFHGFPDALYALQYPAPGLPALARELANDLAADGIDAHIDPDRPLDHGIWSPLSLLWPEADVPLIPVSVPMQLDNASRLDIADALGRWVDTHEMMLIGSGAATHNLGDRHARHDAPDAWAKAFHDWVIDVAAHGDRQTLAQWEQTAPRARHTHPTPEHFLPLMMSVGAMAGAPLTTLHESFMYGNLSMLALGSDALLASRAG